LIRDLGHCIAFNDNLETLEAKMKDEIKSEKILVQKVFSDMWFQIPEYQRPYVWGSDQVSELLEDIYYAMLNNPDSEYFLGSFVFQSKEQKSDNVKFTENDLLDGQQRIITMLLIFFVLKARTKDKDTLVACEKCISQSENKVLEIPERLRIVFKARKPAQDFIEDLLRDKDLSKNDEKISRYKEERDVSVKNMAKAIGFINKFFDEKENEIKTEDYSKFLLNKVMMIYVSTEDLHDAFKLFTILNDRGMPLRNSDILKSVNLGALRTDEEEKKKYTKMWEKAEGELEDNFDRFLNHLRTILVKEKARSDLLKEYEDNIYGKTPPLLEKGKKTFDFIEDHLKNYQQITVENNYNITNDYRFYNLIKIMLVSLPSTDWIPPLLHYYEEFKGKKIFEFLTLLDKKFSADLIVQLTPTARIEAMNRILKEIDKLSDPEDVLKSQTLTFDGDELFKIFDGKIYGRRFAKYVLLKLDYLFSDHSHKMNYETISIEHILPQSPKRNSQWVKDFSEQQREDLADKLGNLVLISKRKNSSLGNKDYEEKKEIYFKDRISIFLNSLRVIQHFDKWDVESLEENQEICLEKLKSHYGIE
jgi:uncharacterized protein with ParB-like and HNH nuclease domain